MRIVIRFIMLAAALAVPAALPAQTTEPDLAAAGAPLDTTFLVAVADSLAILIDVGGDTVAVGTTVLETRVDHAARRLVYLQHLLIEEQERMRADSIDLDWPSLVPVSWHSGGDVPRDYVFGPSGVRITSGRDATTREVPLPTPVFLLTATNLLLRGLPLREGYQAAVPVMSDEGAVGEMTIRVAGVEAVRTMDGGSCRSWVVETDDPFIGGTYRLSTATRGLVRFDSPYATIVRTTGCP